MNMFRLLKKYSIYWLDKVKSANIPTGLYSCTSLILGLTLVDNLSRIPEIEFLNN
jgi:hypothetical protein